MFCSDGQSLFIEAWNVFPFLLIFVISRLILVFKSFIPFFFVIEKPQQKCGKSIWLLERGKLEDCESPYKRPLGAARTLEGSQLPMPLTDQRVFTQTVPTCLLSRADLHQRWETHSFPAVDMRDEAICSRKTNGIKLVFTAS